MKNQTPGAHMKYQSFILIFLSILFAASTWAGDDLWQTFTAESNGLPDNTIISFLEANDGSYWVGTDFGGLAVFRNGLWEIITPDNIDISNSAITALLEDSQGRIWIGTFGKGILIYDGSAWIHESGDENGLLGNKITDLYEDQTGRIWISTRRKGVNVYTNGQWQNYSPLNSDLDDPNIRQIQQANDGSFWFSGWLGGVYHFRNNIWTKYDGTNSTLPGDPVITLYYDKETEILYAATNEENTNNGQLHQFDGTEWQRYDTADLPVQNQKIYAIYKDSRSRFWFGTWDSGIHRFDGNEWTQYSAANSDLPDNMVFTIDEDYQGAFWFGTFGGLTRYEEAIWKTWNEDNSNLISNFILAFESDNEGSQWIGTDRGLQQFDMNGQWQTWTQQNSPLVGNTVQTLYYSSDGSLWIGTNSDGLNLFHNEQWQTFSFELGTLPNNSITDIVEDNIGNLYVATYGGLMKKEGDNWKYFNPLLSQIASFYLNDLTVTDENALWIATNGSGISVYQQDSWQNIRTSNSDLASDTVLSIHATNEGIIYAGTVWGLNEFDGSQWNLYTPSNSGLTDLHVVSIMEDTDGALWFGTEGGGLSKFKNGIWTTVTKENSDLPSHTVRTVHQDNKGYYWFGTYDAGLARYAGDKIPPYVNLTHTPESITGSSTSLFRFKSWDSQGGYNNQYTYALMNNYTIPEETDYSSLFRDDLLELSIMQNGTQTFYIRAIDWMGNVSDPAIWTFQVDITQPTTVIASPSDDVTISHIIPIIGSVYDNSPIKDFEYYNIELGSGESFQDISNWQTIISNQQKEIRNDTLAIFDPTGLNGTYQLKLWAVDSLGHESQDIITIHIGDITWPVKAATGGTIASAGEDLVLKFPPNALKEDTDIRIIPITEISADEVPEDLAFNGLGYDIQPVWTELDKPVVLSLSLPDSLLNTEEISLWQSTGDETEWQLLGGSVEGGKITTALNEFGRIGLFTGNAQGNISSDMNLDCQPRIFSPQGGGHDTQTSISFNLKNADNVTLKIYNGAGRLVRTLCENRDLGAGSNVLVWNGSDEWSGQCPSGLYIVTVETGSKVYTKTVVILNT